MFNILKEINYNKLISKKLKKVFLKKNNSYFYEKDIILSKFFARLAKISLIKDHDEIHNEFIIKVENVKIVN